MPVYLDIISCCVFVWPNANNNGVAKVFSSPYPILVATSIGRNFRVDVIPLDLRVLLIISSVSEPIAIRLGSRCNDAIASFTCFSDNSIPFSL